MKKFALFFCLVFSLPSFASSSNLDSDLREEAQFAQKYLFENFSRSDTSPGAVVAATTKDHPNYYYHWVRDAEIAFRVALDFYPGAKNNLPEFIPAAVRFNLRLQASKNWSGGLGEPKFQVDGSPYNEPWGRPQNDGPALRALSMMKAYRTIQADNRLDQRLLVELYDHRITARSLIKSDLEFVAHHWQETSFDLWEEVNGMHFFTLLAQRRALVDGARFARGLNDGAAADFYERQADKISAAVRGFWDENLGYIVATKDSVYSKNFKESRLDAAVLLASILAGGEDFYGPGSDQVLKTYAALQRSFEGFPVNQEYPGLGTAIGRYPGDTYDGYQTNSLGNPWFLTTHAAAEFLYRSALYFKKQGVIQINSMNRGFFRKFSQEPAHELRARDAEFSRILREMRAEGDRLMARSLFHKGPEGRMSEQLNRDNGFMQGAENLTWSYASFLSAFKAREALSAELR